MTHLPARSSDPLTSWDAADRVVRGGKATRQQALAGEAVRLKPGCTSAELAQHCALDRYQLARRLPELEEAGRVRRGATRKCVATGYSAATWWPA